MSRLESLQRACFCLNITVTIAPEEVLSSTEVEVVRGLFDNSPKLLLVGRLLSTSVKHSILVNSRERQGWTVYSCASCVMPVFAADADSRAVVDESCKRESEFTEITGCPSFSKAFGVVVQNKGVRHSSDVSGCPEDLLAVATESINSERLLVEQRIKAFTYQQREHLEAFRQRTLVELEALSASAVRPEERPSIPRIINCPTGGSSSPNMTPPRGSPTVQVSSTRSGSLILERGTESMNSSSYPSRGSARDSTSLDSLTPDLQSTPPQGDSNDSIFEFEEDVPSKAAYYLPPAAFDQWSQPDNEDDDEDETAEPRVVPPRHPRNEGFQIATSLPISIPQSLKTGIVGSVTNKRGSITVTGSVTATQGGPRGSIVLGGTGAGARGSLVLGDAKEQPPVSVVMPPHTFADVPTRSRKGSEKDAEEQFEHAVRFQSLGQKTRTYV